MNDTEITITPVAGKFDLLTQYQGQTSPQDAYIELDTKTGEMSAKYNPEIGNAVPMRVWHGITRRYSIPVVSAVTANALMMEEIKPLAQRVVDGSEIIWDGNNHIAKFNQDAQEADEEITYICDSAEAWRDEFAEEEE